MFYSHNILERRGGKFGIIWLAATREKTLSKREFYSVHVAQTCVEILNYVTLKEISRAGATQRFSLYLSSQLMYGVTKVLDKQMEYLFGDARRLHKSFASFRLAASTDYFLVEDKYQLQKSGTTASCTLPEPDMDFSLMDPWIANLDMIPMSDRSISELEEFVSMSVIHSSPHRPLMSPDHKLSPDQRHLKEEFERPLHQVSSIDEITLREVEPDRPVHMQLVGEELLPPEISAIEEMLDVNMNLPQDDIVMETSAPEVQPEKLLSPRTGKIWRVDESTGKLMLSPGTKPSHPPKKTSPHKPSPLQKGYSRSPSPVPMQCEQQISPIMMSPTMQTAETATEIAATVEIPALLQLRTPAEPNEVSAPILRLAELQDSSVTLVRHTRKRKLVFADAQTQLSKNQIRKNMQTADDLVQFDVLANPHPQNTVEKLFQEPGRKAMKFTQPLLNQWKFSAQRCPSSKNKPYDPKEPAMTTAYLRPPERILSSSSTSDKALTPEHVPPHEISLSPEKVRLGQSRDDSDASHTKFEDTPVSVQLEMSRDSRDSSRRLSSAAAAINRSSQRSSFLKLHEKIIEENLPETDLFEVEEIQQPVLEDVEPLAPIDEMKLPFPVHEMEPPTNVVVTGGDHVTAQLEDFGRILKDEVGPLPQKLLLQQIVHSTAGGHSVTFKELVPLWTDKKVAAKIFATLLEYCAARIILLNQSKPYSDITIWPV